MHRVFFLQVIIYIISTLGILMGIDLLLGAKITSRLNKILDRTILDFDTIIAGFLSRFRKAVDSTINIDEKIIKTRQRMVLGVLFIAICVFLIFLARKN